MWKNWAGNVTADAEVLKPESVDQLQRAVEQGQLLRCVGSGHSFTPIVEGADTILDLSELKQPTVQSTDGSTAWVNANSRLKTLSEDLSSVGMAFKNLGDINTQTLAGAVATATHGTGKTLPCLSAEILDARILTASGEALVVSEQEPELLSAVQVSLGLLGILLDIKLELKPKFNLLRRTRMVGLPDGLSEMHGLWDRHRNFEFFYLPFTGKCIQIMHDESDAPETKTPTSLDDLGLCALKLFRDVGRINSKARQYLLKLLTKIHRDENYLGESWQVLCSPRSIRFIEMEYHIPVTEAQAVIAEIVKRMETKFPETYFPIEIRQTAGDTAWISPFQGAPRVSVAVHAHASEPSPEFFADMEAIFNSARGRPHWGKMHNLTAPRLADLYPDFERFAATRAKIDPDGKFLTPALRRMFVA